jgi:hypothetical protein
VWLKVKTWDQRAATLAFGDEKKGEKQIFENSTEG